MSASPSIKRLQKELDEIAKTFRGTLGYSLYHTRDGHRIHRSGDEIFPTASTIKIALMGKAMEEVTAGRLDYYSKLPVQEQDRRGGAGFLQNYKDGLEVEIKELIHLMITASDNTATVILTRKLGTVAVNDWLQRHGLKTTRLLLLPPQDAPELVELNKTWGMGMTTPNEMVQLLDLIRTGKAGTPAACDEMLRVLGHQYFDDLIAAQSPPSVQVASKSGAIERSRSDVGIVFSPSGPYILAVYTKEAEDTRWAQDNEGQVAIRQIARRVWTFYHPRERWTPPSGIEKF